MKRVLRSILNVLIIIIFCIAMNINVCAIEKQELLERFGKHLEEAEDYLTSFDVTDLNEDSMPELFVVGDDNKIDLMMWFPESERMGYYLVADDYIYVNKEEQLITGCAIDDENVGIGKNLYNVMDFAWNDVESYVWKREFEELKSEIEDHIQGAQVYSYHNAVYANNAENRKRVISEYKGNQTGLQQPINENTLVLRINCISAGEQVVKLGVRVKENHVWTNAFELAEVLGYSVSYGTDDVLFQDIEKGKAVRFYFDTTSVFSLLGYEFLEYKAPFNAVLEDDVPWVPFEFALLMLDSSIMIVNEEIHILPVQNNILNSLTALMKNSSQRYTFNWERDFGYSDWEFTTIASSSVTVNLLNELIKDPDSYLYSVVGQFSGMAGSYDEKYSDELAMLMMVESKDEMEATITNIQNIYDLMSPDGKLNAYLNEIGTELDNDVGLWQQACDSLLERLKKDNGSMLEYNIAYEQLENVLSRQTDFEETGGLVKSIQEGLPEEIDRGLSFLNVVAKASEFITYIEEFNSQEKYAVAAMEKYCRNSEPNELLSQASLNSMKNKVSELQSNMVEYLISNYLADNWKEWGGKLAGEIIEKSVGDLLAVDAKLIQMAWELTSTYIPFIKDGLDSAEKFELAMYARCFQQNAFQAVLRAEDKLMKNGELDETCLYELAQSYYVYLKACTITREAAVASLASKKYTLGEKVIQQVEEYEGDINKEIAEYLALMKRAKVDKNGKLDNSNMAFGFLPSDNRKYLQNYNDKKLIECILRKEQGQALTNSVIVQESMDSYTDWQSAYASILYAYFAELYTDGEFQDDMAHFLVRIYGNEGVNLTFAVKDIDNNGIPELIIGNDYMETLSECSVLEIYTFSEKKAIRLLDGYGERSQCEIGDDGILYCDGSGGAAYHSYYTYQIGDNGKSLNMRSCIDVDGEQDVVTDMYGIVTVFDGNYDRFRPDYQMMELDWQNLSNESIDRLGGKYSGVPLVEQGILVAPVFQKGVCSNFTSVVRNYYLDKLNLDIYTSLNLNLSVDYEYEYGNMNDQEIVPVYVEYSDYERTVSYELSLNRKTGEMTEKNILTGETEHINLFM